MTAFQPTERETYRELLRLQEDTSKAIDRVTSHLIDLYPDQDWDHDDLDMIREHLMKADDEIASKLRQMKKLYLFVDEG